ncbi:MAG: hypothetical protein J6Y78_08085 [Paludibacteraceae bacterium]|nr:hypothetical protein [Paludibacteraceae bacterium]
MARTLTPRDAHALVNLIDAELTGRNPALTQVTTDNFVSVGETIMTHAYENVYNAISMVMLRTLIAARPVDEDLVIMNALDTGVYSSRLRKISYLTKAAKPSGSFNTQLYTNLASGFTAGENPDSNGVPQSTKSQWEQCPVVPIELNFGGSSVWDHGITWYKDQAKNAFQDESSFLQFWAGALTENANDIKREKSAYRRAILLNFIAGMYDLRNVGCTVRNLTADFNTKYGTSYTTAQLKTTYRKEFLAFFVETFKLDSLRLQKSSVNYHVGYSKVINGETHVLLRHTPRDRQRVILYEPMFVEAKANVLPEIFNPEYLDLNTQYEGMLWWQNENDPEAISVVPSIPDFGVGTQITGNPVALDHVVGLIYDVDGMMTNFQLDDANTTNLEARKRFRNTWYTMARGGLNDFTEKAVLYIMAD